MISSPLELIKMLKNTKGLFVTCPGCGDERPINRVDLCTESSLSKRILRYMEERKIQIGESKVELEELKRKQGKDNNEEQEFALDGVINRYHRHFSWASRSNYC